MSELELTEFRARAEELVDLPDLTELENRGRRLRRRRVAVGAAAAAVVLAVTGGIIVDQRDDGRPEPADDRNPHEVDYPGPVMEILDAGTYVLKPSVDPGAPQVRLTLPAGWNAWQGPNRFDGDIETTEWYAGLLVVDPEAVASRPCELPLSDDWVSDDPAEVVAALKRLPLHRVSVVERSTEPFGYPATRLRIQATRAFTRQCPDVNVIRTAVYGTVGLSDAHGDTWVVDVDGRAYVVTAGDDPKTPRQVQRELDEIVDSIEFFYPE